MTTLLLVVAGVAVVVVLVAICWCVSLVRQFNALFDAWPS